MTHPNPSTAMAQVVLDELSRHGVRHVVIAPGSRSAALAMAAASSGDFEIHIELDERSAGFLALGIGRSTGTAAVVITTSGTAVANLHPSVVEADLGVVPLILLTADRPPELRDRGANQTIDQRAVFGSSVRWEFDPGPAEDTPASNGLWRSMASRAAAVSSGRIGRPGPVHLNLPFREPLVPASDDGRTVADPFSSPTEGRRSNRPWTVTGTGFNPDGRHRRGRRTDPGRGRRCDGTRRTRSGRRGCHRRAPLRLTVRQARSDVSTSSHPIDAHPSCARTRL